jgi:cyclic lactone autoinducer peptide
MKQWIAKHANAMLSAFALTMVATASYLFFHRPEAPKELLK